MIILKKEDLLTHHAPVAMNRAKRRFHSGQLNAPPAGRSRFNRF